MSIVKELSAAAQKPDASPLLGRAVTFITHQSEEIERLRSRLAECRDRCDHLTAARSLESVLRGLDAESGETNRRSV